MTVKFHSENYSLWLYLSQVFWFKLHSHTAHFLMAPTYVFPERYTDNYTPGLGEPTKAPLSSS